MNILGISARRAVLALAFLAACSVPSQTYTPLDDAGPDAPTDATEVVELSVSTTNITVVEGQTATFTVQLTAQPAEPVLVSVDSEDDNRVGVAPTSLQFTSQNWNQPRTITLSGRVDANTVDEALNVTVSSSVGTKTVAVIVDDIDMLSVIATPMSMLQVDEGATAQVAVHLSAQPTGPVTVTVMSSNLAAATASPATLTFGVGTWDVDQNVVVSGVVDADTTNGTADLMLMATNVTGAVVPITVVDRDVLQIVPLPTNLGTLTEGGTTTFTVALNHQPPANVSVAVASSDTSILTVSPTPLAFTTANWMTPQTVTVNLPQDIDTANETASISLTATGLTTRTVTANITDNDTQTVIAAPDPVAIDEGMTGTLNVHLQFQPSADITLTVTSLNTGVATVPAGSLTFTPANYATDQAITVTAVQDPDAAPGMTTIRLESLPDSLSKNVAVAVTDDDQLLIEASMPTVTLAENGSVQFGVRLTAMPGANVTVSASSGDTTAATVSPAMLTFTPANYGTFQMVTVTGVSDVDLASETVTLTLSAAGLLPRTVTATVNDDDVQAVLVSSGTIQVGEGATGQVGVSLAFMPAANVTVSVTSADPTAATVSPATLTFTPANYATAQNITITGVQDADALNDLTTVNLTATGATAAAVNVTVNDDEVLGIQATVSNINCNEPGTATFGVHLSAQPTGDTVVMVMSSDVSAATAAPAMLTFTTANYATNQTVTITGVSDPDGINDTLTINLTATGLTMVPVNVTVIDDDIQDILLSATTLTVGEAGSGTFGVHLAAMPAANVVVTVASADSNKATASPSMLTFTPANYTMDQTVTVSGVADLNMTNESVAINMSSAGVPTRSVAVTVTDDDTQVVESNATGTIALTEGQPGVDVGFRLRFQPAANTTVTLNLGTGLAVAGGNTLTFTSANYNTYQNKTISALQDPDAAPVTTSLTATSPGAATATVNYQITDDDMLLLEVAPASLSVTEGTTQTFQVRLTAQPLADTVVTSTSLDPSVATITGGASLTFTTANYGTFQNVTVNGVQDVDVASEATNVTVASTGLPSKNVGVTVVDDDMLTIVTAPASVTVTEGATATFTVALSNQPSSNVSVGVASSAPSAATVSPATLAFDSINWNTPQTVTVTGVSDADALDGSSTIALTSASTPTKNVSATVLDDDITLTSMSVQMGPPAGGGVSNATGTGFTAAVSTTMASNAVIGWFASSGTSANFTIPAKSATGGNWSDLRMVKAGNTVSIPRAHYYGQWQPISVGGGTAYVVKTAGASIVYAGTYSGVYVSSNNGATWTRATPNGGGGWYDDLAIHPTNPDIAYVPLFDGVYGTTDRGATWARMGSLSVSTSCVAVNPATPTTIYACTNTEVQRSTDSGATWTVVKSGLSSPRMISFNNGTNGWLATNAGIFRTTDGGATWNPANGQLGNPSAVAIVGAPSAGAVAYVSIQGGPPSGIMKTTDGGVNWSTQASSVTPSDFAIHPTDPNVVYASTGQGVFQTTNGSTWAEIDTGVPTWAQQTSGVALRASTPAEVYRVGPTGVYKSTTSGSSWTKSDSGMDAYNVSEIATHPTTAGTLAIATATGAFRSTDYGATWTQIMSGVTNTSGSVNSIVYAPSQPATMFMNIAGGNLWKSTDSGSTWSMASSVTNSGAIAVDTTNPLIVYLGHYPEFVLKSTDGGATFAAASSGIPANANIYDLATVGSTVIAADGVAGIYRSTNGGASWALSNTGFPAANGARVLSVDGLGTVYAITNGGGYRPYKSTDGGATWTQVASFGEAIAIDPTRPATGYITSFTSVSRTLDSFASTSSFSLGPLPTNSCCVGSRIAVDKDGSAVYFGPPERGLFRIAP